MAVSYWARWACNGQIDDLPDLILPLLLEEGYELLSQAPGRQNFDRGGVIRKIAWSLNGGRWSDAPVDLTISYSYAPQQTIANFYWKLSVRPLPATAREQAAFEAHIQQQMARLFAQLNEQLLAAPVEAGVEAAQEGASLQACWEQVQGYTEQAAMAAVRQPGHSFTLQHAGGLDEPSRCNACQGSTVPVPGTGGRHFCLKCRRHVSANPAA